MFHALIAIGENTIRSHRVTKLVTYFLVSTLLFNTMVANAKLLPDIYWNSTNRIFRIDNTDHVYSVKLRDRINIRCPKYDPVQVFDPNQVEYSEIYNVPRWGYDNCMLTHGAKIVGVCRTPFHESVITVVFREYTPLPGGLEFQAGRSYFFISTSLGTQDGLSSKQGGLCEQKNMRLKFEVSGVDDDATIEEADSKQSNNNGSPLTPLPLPPAQKQTTTSTDKSKFAYLSTTSAERFEQRRENPFVNNNNNNNDNGLAPNSNSAVADNNRVMKNNSSLLTRPTLETTTTSVWYEIHTRHPDDMYSNQPKDKNNNLNSGDNNSKGDKARIRGHENGDKQNSESQVPKPSGALSNYCIYRLNLFHTFYFVFAYIVIFNVLRIDR